MSSQKKSSRLEGKDLITIGIYTVIYVVIVMLVAMLGFIPIFIPLMAVLCPLIGGIPYMLYVTKAKKFGMTAIMGFLIGPIIPPTRPNTKQATSRIGAIHIGIYVLRVAAYSAPYPSVNITI